MISEELLQTLDPAELENLYVSTHLDKILAVRKPVQIIENSIQIRITTLNLEFSKQAYIKTIFGGKIRESNPCAPELLPKTFLFNVTYHNIIFDSVIIEFINCGSLISNDTVGRLRIKLSELESCEIQRYSLLI